MSKYRVTFIYGSWRLWADIENQKLDSTDRRGFADLAQNAVKLALDSMPQIERKYIAHDYAIFELSAQTTGETRSTLVYAFETLSKE